MSRSLALLAVLTLAGPAAADPPVSVPDLVRQLGDETYARREAAQQELLRRGEGIVPELDRLAKTADAEAAERLRKIRFELVGYLDDIQRLLQEVYEGKDRAPVPVSPELRGLIASHQPGAGNLLLAILSDRKHRLEREALRAFVSTWDVATPDQIDAYVRRSVSVIISHRPKLPAKVGAMISVEARLRNGWTGWPPIGAQRFDFRARTTEYVDGKAHDKSLSHPFPVGTVGRYRVGELAEGKHTIQVVLEYEFTHRGETRRGEIRSNESLFEVVSGDTPDDLIAPNTVDTANYVRASFALDDSLEPEYVVPREPPAEPQVCWEVSPGKWAGLVCPTWALHNNLKVDLCFEAEIEDWKTGKVYPAGTVCVVAGEKSRGYLVPDDPRAFAENRDGFVRVTVTLKPSRSVALSNPNVTRYFPAPIVEKLRMPVFQTLPPTTEPK